MTKNSFDRREWSGAFGDLGIFIPFVVGYIAVVKMNPSSIFVSFGVFLIVSGFHYKTPFPVQPMKAIGGAAITGAGAITPGMIWGAGFFTGAFWLIAGLSGVIGHLSKIAGKAVVKGIVLGLGISFIMDGTDLMRTGIPVAAAALALVFALSENRYVPAMFALIVFGITVQVVQHPGVWHELASIRPSLSLPEFPPVHLTWQELGAGIFVLAVPQIPLSLGNAVIAVTAENNRLFPDRPVSEKKTAVFQGIMNLASPLIGGVPMCHGAGGMAAHVRFGARTGGAVVIFGVTLVASGLLFGDSALILLSLIPSAVLGAMMFFAGLEMALSARDASSDKKDFCVLIVTAGFSLWNVGIGFATGVIMQEALKRNVFKV